MVMPWHGRKAPPENRAQQTMFALCSQCASRPPGRYRVEDLVQHRCPAFEGVVPAAIVPAAGTEAVAKLVVGGELSETRPASPVPRRRAIPPRCRAAGRC